MTTPMRALFAAAAVLLVTVGLCSTNETGTYFGTNVVAQFTPPQEAQGEAGARDYERQFVGHLGSFSKFLADNGEPSLDDGPGANEAVFRYAIVGNFVNSGSLIARFERQRGTVVKHSVSGTRGRPRSMAMEHWNRRIRILSQEDAARFHAAVDGIRSSRPPSVLPPGAIDAPGVFVEFRDSTTHTVWVRWLRSEGDEPFWRDMERLGRSGGLPSTGPRVIGISFADGYGRSRTRTVADVPTHLRFQLDGPGSFRFDTGALRGRLHADDRSVGLTEVVHEPTQTRLDSREGLLIPHQVYSQRNRIGTASPDWPSTAALLSTGEVEVTWPTAPDRPFALYAWYRLADTNVVEVEAAIEAGALIQTAVATVAAFFDPAFTNEVTLAAAAPSLPPGRASTNYFDFDWQVGLRGSATSNRSGSSPRLKVTLTANGRNCFNAILPHETEARCAVLFLLCGHHLPYAHTASARVRLSVLQEPDGPAP